MLSNFRTLFILIISNHFNALIPIVLPSTMVSISSHPSRILLLEFYFIAIFFSESFLVSRILLFC